MGVRRRGRGGLRDVPHDAGVGGDDIAELHLHGRAAVVHGPRRRPCDRRRGVRGAGRAAGTGPTRHGDGAGWGRRTRPPDLRGHARRDAHDPRGRRRGQWWMERRGSLDEPHRGSGRWRIRRPPGWCGPGRPSGRRGRRRRGWRLLLPGSNLGPQRWGGRRTGGRRRGAGDGWDPVGAGDRVDRRGERLARFGWDRGRRRERRGRRALRRCRADTRRRTRRSCSACLPVPAAPASAIRSGPPDRAAGTGG